MSDPTNNLVDTGTITDQTTALDTATDVQTDATATDSTTDQAADTKADDPAAVEYTDFTVPDGIEVDAKLLEQFLPIAKELNLSQEQAQKLVDLRIADVKAQIEAFETQKEAWKQEVHNDPEIGGGKLTETLALAGKTMDKYGSPALKEALDRLGIGNHPEMVKLFAKVGKDLSEDTIPITATHTSGMTAEQALNNFYPSMAKK